MKTTIFNKKAPAFFGAAAILLAAVFTIGCKTDAGSGDPAPETFAVTFSVSGGNGNVRAKVDGKEIETGAKVEQGKTVEFTANPDYDWTIGKWTVEGGKFEKYTGTAGSTTAKVKVSAATTVSVKFTKNGYTVIFDAKGGSPVPAEQTLKYKEKVSKPSPVPTKKGHTFEGWYNKDGDVLWDFDANEVTKSTELYAKWKINEYTVTFGIEGTPANGTLKAEVGGTVINTNDKIEYGKIVTFSAAPAEYCKVEKWTIAGGAFEAGTGTEGSATAKVKISADTKVTVSFKVIVYDTVSFADLKTYLENTASSTDINYIKVIGLTSEDLKGDSGFYAKSSALGKILNKNRSKKVALKLGEISGLRDMHYCFYACTSLVQAPVIPSSVTDMYSCFRDCTSLVQAPAIPNSVTDIKACFKGCKSLTQLSELSNGVTDMEECFVNCTSLTQAPVIPSSVTNMDSCFSGCTSLTQVPDLPNGVTNMSSCFSGCENLTQAPVIPSGVTDMKYCFDGCTSLTQAPVIPSSVTNMRSCFSLCKNITAVTLKCNYRDSFSWTFYECEKLTEGSIKVPAGQLQKYKDNAGTMGTTADRFVAE